MKIVLGPDSWFSRRHHQRVERKRADRDRRRKRSA